MLEDYYQHESSSRKNRNQHRKYEFSLVPADKLSLVWNESRKIFKKSANRSGGRERIEDIYYEL